MHKYLPALTAICIAAIPTVAHAHAPSPGMQGFWLGAAHPVLTIMQMPALIGMGLRLGQLPLRDIRIGLSVLLTASLLGVLTGLMGMALPFADALMLATAMAIAAFAVINKDLPLGITIVLAGLIGFVTGYANAPDTDAGDGVIPTTLGAYVSMNMIVVMIAGGLDYAKTSLPLNLVSTGIRVLGSWTFVIALLLLILQVGTPA